MNKYLKKFYFVLTMSFLYLLLTSRFGVYSIIDIVVWLASTATVMLEVSFLLKLDGGD